MKSLLSVLLLVCFAAGTAFAQFPALQYYRPIDKSGINTFETSKKDTTPYTGMKLRVGGAFAQDYQFLTHSNTPVRVLKSDSTSYNLMPLTSGFNLAEANMFLDGQLADGIRVNLTVYLSARHHNESWVKGGYLQMDKLPFLHMDALDDLMKNVTIKVGDFEPDYGDAHYRRTDGGNEMYNPFVENYIMDDFATEVGGEVLYHGDNGILGTVGVTSGMLNSTVVAASKIDSATGSVNTYNPAFVAKLGYDNQITPDFRFRLTGSIYTVSSTSSNTLFGGDRTGSHYFYVMENTAATTTANPFSGRFNPSFSEAVTAFMVNPFVKFGGLEFFGMFETASGRTITESTTRKATQYSADVIYRFGPNEEFWVAGRYNNLAAQLPKTALNPAALDVSINRIVGSIGWFITNNVMMKAEYVSQQYKDFPNGDIRHEGKFSGEVIEAAIGF